MTEGVHMPTNASVDMPGTSPRHMVRAEGEGWRCVDCLMWFPGWPSDLEACPGKVGPQPIPMRLPCPSCSTLHIDEGEFATKPHHTHACQFCGMVWRPAVEATVGVRFLPGFKNEEG